MSYSINVSGHKETASAEESKAFEEEILEKARDFAASLEGVTGASFSGGNVGTVDLRAQPEAPASG